MNTNKSLYRCPACGREQKMRPGRHWCKCLADQPFEMTPVRITRLVDKIMASVAKGAQ